VNRCRHGFQVGYTTHQFRVGLSPQIGFHGKPLFEFAQAGREHNPTYDDQQHENAYNVFHGWSLSRNAVSRRILSADCF
jgi:hypothetical protein